MGARVERKSIECRHCGVTTICSPQEPKKRYCNQSCYYAWRKANPDKIKNIGRPRKPPAPKEKPEKFKPYSHNFTKEVTNLIQTGRYPMFL